MIQIFQASKRIDYEKVRGVLVACCELLKHETKEIALVLLENVIQEVFREYIHLLSEENYVENEVTTLMNWISFQVNQGLGIKWGFLLEWEGEGVVLKPALDEDIQTAILVQKDFFRKLFCTTSENR